MEVLLKFNLFGVIVFFTIIYVNMIKMCVLIWMCVFIISLHMNLLSLKPGMVKKAKHNISN
jgi:hypothetical protein